MEQQRAEGGRRLGRLPCGRFGERCALWGKREPETGDERGRGIKMEGGLGIEIEEAEGEHVEWEPVVW